MINQISMSGRQLGKSNLNAMLMQSMQTSLKLHQTGIQDSNSFFVAFLIDGVLTTYKGFEKPPETKSLPVGTIRWSAFSGSIQVMKKRPGKSGRKSWAPAKTKHRNLMKTYLLIEGVSL